MIGPLMYIGLKYSQPALPPQAIIYIYKPSSSPLASVAQLAGTSGCCSRLPPPC